MQGLGAQVRLASSCNVGAGRTTLGRMAPHPVIPKDERNLVLTAKTQLANASYFAWKLTR